MRANSAIFMYFYTAYGFLLKIEINTTSKHDRNLLMKVVFASFLTISLTILQSIDPLFFDQAATREKLEKFLKISFESETFHVFPFVRHFRLFKLIMNTIVKRIVF